MTQNNVNTPWQWLNDDHFEIFLNIFKADNDIHMIFTTPVNPMYTSVTALICTLMKTKNH